MHKRGTHEAVIYFRNYRDPAHPVGYLMLAPYSDFPTPAGYERCGAESLSEVDKLQRVLIYQERASAQNEYFHDEATFGARQQAIRDRLYARMVSDSTSPYERDFIKSFLELRDEKKREKYAAAFEHRAMYLHARENDTPKNRRVDDESFRVDRIG